MQTSLHGIERKATKNEKHKFQNLYLYKLLNKYNLSYSWRGLNKRAAKGIDRQSAIDFERNMNKELSKLEDELRKGNYHTKLVRQVEIEKSNGGKRPLGIPKIRDKLVQKTCSQILETIHEPVFLQTRYGYRKGKGAKDAVKHLGKELNFGKYGYIVEADIKRFFQNISHEWIERMLKEKIEDKRFIRLITKWLKAGIMKEGNRKAL